jgi:hypothetical protein
MRMTVLTAYLAGKMSLPPGYGLEYDANVLLLRRRDGSVLATFSATDVAPALVAHTAEADCRARYPENP